MSDSFDPYHKWLGIRPEEQPPSFYRLLGISPWEDDADVIHGAAEQRMAYVRNCQLGPHCAQSQVILNELANARLCLLDPLRRAVYDQTLRDACGQQQAWQSPRTTPDTTSMGLDVFSLPVQPSYRGKRLVASFVAGILVLFAVFTVVSVVKDKQWSSPAPAGRQVVRASHLLTTLKPSPPPSSSPIDRRGTSSSMLAGVRSATQPATLPPASRSHVSPAPVATKLTSPTSAVKALDQAVQHATAAFTRATTTRDYQAVAMEALGLITSARAAGRKDLAKSLATLALTASRRSDIDELVNKSTVQLLELGEAK